MLLFDFVECRQGSKQSTANSQTVNYSKRLLMHPTISSFDTGTKIKNAYSIVFTISHVIQITTRCLTLANEKENPSIMIIVLFVVRLFSY